MARNFDGKEGNKKVGKQDFKISTNTSVTKKEVEEDFEITDDFKERKYTKEQLKNMEAGSTEEDGLVEGVYMLEGKRKSNFWRNFLLLDVAIGAVTSVVLLFTGHGK